MSQVLFDAKAFGARRKAQKMSVDGIAKLCMVSKSKMSTDLRNGIMREDALRSACKAIGVSYEAIARAHTQLTPREIALPTNAKSEVSQHPIAIARQREKLSQRALAALLPSLGHMSLNSVQREISYYENGKSVPTPAAQELKALLGLELPLGYDDPPSVPTYAGIERLRLPSVVRMPEANGDRPHDAALNRMLHAASRNPDLTLSDFLRDEYRDQYVSMLEERCTFLQSQVWNGKT